MNYGGLGAGAGIGGVGGTVLASTGYTAISILVVAAALVVAGLVLVRLTGRRQPLQ